MKKDCTKCGETKTAEEFGFRSGRLQNKKYLHSQCRDCRNEYKRMVKARSKLDESKRLELEDRKQSFIKLPSYAPAHEIENFNELDAIF